MMAESGGLTVRPWVAALMSVSLIGGQSVTVNLAAICFYNSSATGDCPAACTGVSCCTVTAAGAGYEIVAGNIAAFLKNLFDIVGLSRYVEMRDLLTDVVYVLGRLDMRGSGPCKIQNFPSGDRTLPSGLPVRQQAGLRYTVLMGFLIPIGVGQHWWIR